MLAIFKQWKTVLFSALIFGSLILLGCTIDKVTNYPTYTPPSKCDSMQKQESKDKCYLALASSNKKYAICDRIKTTVYKDWCIAHTATDPSSCQLIQNQNRKDSCYELVAMRIDNFSICEKIRNMTHRTECSSMEMMQ